ncbi:hypothetical protein EYC08_19495 [Tabrizicola sp. WMC-M-20]|nr:hypothetical protein EYC08_19495 [Tabrizicola sp. WMC-M-20]
MSLDPISETIAHFIGAFQISEEAARLRIEYEKFSAARAVEEEAERLELMGVRLKAPHELEDYNPEISYSPPATTIVPLPIGMVTAPPLHEVPVYDVPTPANAPSPEFAPPQPGPAAIIYNLPAPSSLIAVTVQHNTLSDNDQFSVRTPAAFQDIGAVDDLLALLKQQAANMSPIDAAFSALSTDWFGLARAVQARAPEEADGVAGTLTVSVKTGAATEGIHVNGALAIEMPDWAEFKPIYFQAKEPAPDEPVATEDDDAEGPTTVITSVSATNSQSDAAHHGLEKDFGDIVPDPVPDPGLEVVAGANLMINETVITSAWLDGKVIAVGGDVLDYKAISQVNVVVDHDSVPFGIGVAPSVALNMASIVTESATPAPVTDAEIAEATAKASGGQPSAWAVVRVEADVIQINWSQQYSFATDHDRAEIEVTGNSLYLGLGDNTLSNLIDMLQIGFVYDLIIVGGNLIDMTLIKQTNVLLDSDVVAVSALGDLLLTDSIATDLPDPAEAEADTRPETPTVPPVSTGDNLLVNQAAITTVGEDSIEAITDTFTAAVNAFVAGATGVSSDVLASEFFEGVELLRVLYISGNFITVNVLEQTNVLGDADQVHLAAANFADQLGAQISLVTGSNILGNFASITDRGVDSTIFASGEVYSDALIHQANLIDTSDMPTAEGLASLTTEAVAFLADGLIDSNMAADVIAATHTSILGSFAHHEVMSSSMLG